MLFSAASLASSEEIRRERNASEAKCKSMREIYKRRFEDFDSVASRVMALPSGDRERDIARSQQREREKNALEALELRIVSECN